METRLLKESYLEVVNYSVTHKNGNRSSVRTDILNSYIRQFFFDEIIDAMASGNRVELRGFGPKNTYPKGFIMPLYTIVNKKTKKNIYVFLLAKKKELVKTLKTMVIQP